MFDSESHVRILWTELPESERDDACMVSRKIIELNLCRNRFKGALALLDFSQAAMTAAKINRDCVRAMHHAGSSEWNNATASYRDSIDLHSIWLNIAGRDAAITLWDFAASLYAIRERTELCPTLKSFLKPKSLEHAVSLFHQHFPNAKKIRHASAHPSDMTNTPEANAASQDLDAFGFRIRNSSEYMISGMYGRDVVVTIGHEVLSCKLAEETVATLIQIEDAVNAVFVPAALATKEMLWKRMQSKGA